MRMLLAGTDVSSPSDRALHRAALMAREFKARLLLLHVGDDDQPSAAIDRERRQATALLDGRAHHLAGAPPDVLMKTGEPSEVIVETAREQQADLIVMGAHRKRLLRDIFGGTTIERVMRTGGTPVPVVNAHPNGAYRRVLLAVDLSESSARAARVAKALGLLDSSDVSIVHAFRPYARALLDRTGADQEVITRHVVHTAVEVASELTSFLDREGLNDERHEITLEEGDPFAAIKETVRRQNPDLLVIGTRGHTGLKRLLLGSVANEVLRHVECDVLAVPPAQISISSAPMDGARIRLDERRFGNATRHMLEHMPIPAIMAS